ncbi:hypothetical protein Poli38472_007795 [Pythium oligandrum]|uniref:Uncharacterized protein n=1 Tax=Pythium oligandrum TaxID=41045 RepID=A0A8K1CTR4_PYTOL|nr:hypothetical protein Poli38472_007795 [Pythium oligandrum]|eukprot:TMW68123.1 hypothetical protein Poli38472_007795 [Pythium oligandrum]
MFMKKTTPATSPCFKPGAKPQDKAASSNNALNGGGLPALGRMNPSHVQSGMKVWVSDPKVLWRIGEVQSVANDQQTAQVYVPDAPDDKIQTLSLSKLYAFDPSHIVDHDDIAQMNNMHEAPLLNVLRQRFEADKIYTFTADILLSINPYKTIPLLYDVLGFMERIKTKSDVSKSEPHLFTIAEKAYSGMKGLEPGSGTPQSIIVSGESGAGKTEASKYIMKYLATASRLAAQSEVNKSGSAAASSAMSVHQKIEECVVLSNLILESFGNAKTSRNDNSSRFGKYIQIHYNIDGRMACVSIRHFLLEKTRLIMPQASERNYHIFYQLLAGLKSLDDITKRLKLTDDVWNYSYLTRGDCVEVDGVDDAAEFEQLRKCMDQLGLDKAGFQYPLFELLAAMLHLGNLQFENVKESGSNNNEESTTPVFPESNRGINLELVSSLLGVDPKEFAKKMVTQTTITGRGSILEMKLNAEQAKNAMDAFCKYLYGELFSHLIARINSYAKEQTALASDTRTKQRPGTVAPFIGILDIFGFEVMKKNSLEQLCINFTNETLQQQFNKHVFVLEQERYAAEGIAFSSVEFRDNQPCLDLIQKPPMGLLPLLEEQMLLKRKTTDKQLLTIYHGNHLEKHANYTKPRFECDEFVIRHYAGEVTYDINEFIAKNTDNLHDDLLDLMRSSQQPLLKAMFSAVEQPVKRATGAPSPAAPGKKVQGNALTGASTVSSRFRMQLTELMDVLWNTSPNYIKCIKPNTIKFPGGFSCELVRDQLVYSGVLEVVRIRQEGFPIRKRFDVFYEMFWPLTIAKYPPGYVLKDPARIKEATDFIATEWLERKNPSAQGKRPFAMGRQEIFLRYGQVERLEALAATLRHEKAVRVQARLKGWVMKKRFQVIRRGVRAFQALWRMHVTKNRFSQMRKASVRIQTTFRRFRMQKRYKKQLNAARVVFRSSLRFLTRKRFMRWQRQSKAATKIQCHVRGYLTRTAAERARKLRERSILAIQAWFRMTKHRRVFMKKRKAAVKIQSAYRALTTRRAFLLRKKASIVLEAFFRQFIQRRRFKLLKNRIVKIQAILRKRKHRQSYVALCRAALYVQSKHRQKHAMALSTQRFAAKRTVQHAMLGWIRRCRYLSMKRSAKKLQFVIKSWLLRREYRQAKTSVRVIQLTWRKYIRTQRWRNELALLFRLPGAIATSSLSWSHHGKMEDSDRRMQRLRLDPQLYFNLRPKAYGYNTLFHHGAACGDFHVVKYMLEQSIMPQEELFYIKNGAGCTAFHVACSHGQYEMAKFLLQQAKVIQDAKNRPKPVVTTVKGSKRGAGRVPKVEIAKQEEPEQDLQLPVGPIYQGYLKKRRETSRWMKRYVMLSINEQHQPQLEYYANDKATTLQAKSAKTVDLHTALFKKSMDVPFAFEIHSPELLQGRNKEGRLYFAAENELEIQKWLAHLRDTIPSSIESRLFAMHRGNKSGQLEFVDFEMRKTLCSVPCTSARRETPLHLAAGALVYSPNAGPLDGGSSIEVAVSASAISISIDEERGNQRSSVIPSSFGGEDGMSFGKTKIEMEADVVKTVLWLVENGADMNALTTNDETPLQLALQAKNYIVAKHLLDRGALAGDLPDAEYEDAQKLKMALAKNAINSIGSMQRLSSASSISRAASFMRKATLTSPAAPLPQVEEPPMFLQRQPGKIRNSSYVSVFVELLGISNPHYLLRPGMLVSVLDSQRNPVERKQQVSVQPLVLPSSMLWSFTWHMQTPLENLPHGACVVFELTMAPTPINLPSNGGISVTVPTCAAYDYVPVCWTYIQVDQRTANSMPMNTEMYKYPMDLTLKKLQRADAFMNGEIFISKGPQ